MPTEMIGFIIGVAFGACLLLAGLADPDKIVAGDVFTATGNTPNVVIQAGFNTAGLSLPETIIDVTGAYTALDESGLEVGWDIDDAPVGGLIRITSTGGPPVIPTLNEWGMIILSFLLAAFAVRTIRSRRYNVA